MDYTKVGYDEFLRRDFTQFPEITEDDVQIKTPEIPTSTVKGDVPQDQIQKAVNNISRLSQVTTATAASVLNGNTALLTSTISDIYYPDKVMFAIPEITAYYNAISASNIIYPTASWSIDQGFSYYYNSIRTDNSKSLTYTYAIRNTSGSTMTIYWVIRWRFIGTNTAA